MVLNFRFLSIYGFLLLLDEMSVTNIEQLYGKTRMSCTTVSAICGFSLFSDRGRLELLSRNLKNKYNKSISNKERE
ncbi:hypothetical protein BRE01_36940 [Brevibacillus reuszeri]|uniref:Transposase n=1 Tax=Brevibacillus reuszeri TaxID=54915 RepID=A0ABQ0TQ53_9BACL|nr:hypothetical protein BRE01_36940 [Brevibacillus reuszeri]